MTIKTQGGKVITKEGKVSCSCCEEPESCCMYSAQNLMNGVYSAADLPDAVTIGGVSYSRSGTSYGDTTNGVLYEDGVWARYTNGERNERACLIQGGVVDQFASSYIIDPEFYAGYGSFILPRSALCIWNDFVCDFSAPRSFTAEVRYNEFSGKWLAAFIDFDIFPDDEEFPCIPSGLEVFGEKVGSQNSPVGTYYDDFQDVNFTVS